MNVMLTTRHVFLSLLLFKHSLGKDQTVPVLFWSPETSMSALPEVKLSNVLEQGSFNGDYLKPLMVKPTHSAVIFLQDKLHMDDFSKYADVYSVEGDGGVFKNIKGLMDSSFSLELPRVAGAGESVAKLVDSFPEGSVHHVTSAAELDDLDLNPRAAVLILVQLATDGGEEAALARNDEIIGSVCHKLTKRGLKYTAMYTGQEAGRGFEDQESAAVGRHLLADDESDKGWVFLNITDKTDSPMFLYMRSMKICVASEGKCDLFDIDFGKINTDESSKNGSTGVIKLSMPDIKTNKSSELYDAKLIMNVEDQKDRWVANDIILEFLSKSGGNISISNGSLSAVDLDLKVPILYSFHCTQLKLFLDTVSNKGEYKAYAGTYVYIEGFQVQPFNIQNDRFFNSLDCVPFFTSGILMGLFPTLLLLSILLGGTMMLLSLSIMDKYDDPKGKTISVNVGGD